MNYAVELKNLHLDDSDSKTLQVIEMLCDEYKLGDQFGIISMSVKAVLDIINFDDIDYDMSVQFMLQSNILSVLFSVDKTMKRSAEEITQSDEYFILDKLTDDFDIKDNGKDIYIMFHVKPTVSVQREVPRYDMQTKKNKIINHSL